jgi:predicted CoA-binding protein
MTIPERIETFLAAEAFGVVGASSKPHKYGNKVLRCYQQNRHSVVPVNPVEKTIEGLDCVHSVDQLPDNVSSISIITPPQVTEKVVALAISNGIKNIWMQPGAESPQAVAKCEDAGVNVIADGSCLLVVLGYQQH